MVLPGAGRLTAASRARKRTYWQSVAHDRRAGGRRRWTTPTSRGSCTATSSRRTCCWTRTGTVWVTDFGLAKADDQTNLTQHRRHPRHAALHAPGGFEGKTDARSDVYALGLTLYEMLAFRPAFDEKDRHRLIKQVTADGAGPAGQARTAQCRRDLETIVHKAIDKDPKDATRRPGAGRGPAAVPGRRTDPGAAGRSAGAGVDLGRGAASPRRALLLVGAVAALALVGAGVAFVYNSRLEAALDEAEFQRYFHHIARAAAGCREGNMAQVEELLDECPTQPARLGMALPQAAVSYGPAHAQRPHRCRQWSGLQSGWDSSGFGGLGRHVRIWDAITGQELLTLPGHTGVVYAVVYSPDGKKLASAGYDKTVRVWDAITGQLIRKLEGYKYSVHSVAFSPDGRRLVTGDYTPASNVRVWDVTTGLEVFSPLRSNDSAINSVAYSPDGRWLASASPDSILRIWSTTNGQQVLNLPAATSGATAVAFSPDGRRFATGSLEGTVKVWDVATGQLLGTLTGHTSGVTSVTFGPDGRRLASSSFGGVIKVWDRDAMNLEPRTHNEHSWQSGQGASHAHGPHRLGHSGRVQPRRDATGLGQYGRHDQSLGRGANRKPAPSKVSRGVQPGREMACLERVE